MKASTWTWILCLALGACGGEETQPIAADPPTAESTDPKPADEPLPLKADANGGGFHLELIPSPHPIPLNLDFSLRFRLLDNEGKPLAEPLKHIALDADMPEHGHGMKIAPVLEEKDGWIHASPLLFHMPGLWEIYVDRTQGHLTERAQLSFKVY